MSFDGQRFTSGSQDQDIDWESFVAHSPIQPSPGLDVPDVWQYDTPSWLDSFPQDQTSTAALPFDDVQDLMSASPDDGLNTLLARSLGHLSNDLEVNFNYDDGKSTNVTGLQAPEPSNLIERLHPGNITSQHHSCSRDLNQNTIAVAEEAIEETCTSLTTPSSVQDKPSTPKRKRMCQRKPRDKAPQPPQVIEKRYRNSLNDKIAELKVLVPTLRARVEGVQSGEELLLAGLEPARNLKKSVVLAKTIEYIKHLEDCNEAVASHVMLPV